MAIKTDENGNIILKEGHGKKDYQKLKPYLVMRYLLQKSDESHAVRVSELIQYLKGIGIYAERRSIYSDIEQINIAMLMAEKDLFIEEAVEELEEYGDESRYIVYNPNKKGYYVRERRFELDEIRLAAESIYASKFLTANEADTLVNLICSFVSEHQAKQIKHDVLLTDRVKTNNERTFRNVSTINAAMSRKIDGEKHIPEKISFKYLKYTISDIKQQAERRQGARYIVSPYALLLNDGNYYLLAFGDKEQEIRTYRVGRMRDIRLTRQSREGAEAFRAIDLKSYTQRVFSMYSGKQERVTIRFINPLLDTVIDRFGTSGVKYYKADDKHFNVVVNVEISNQFFGWICGLGNKAKIIDPLKVKEQFAEYIEKIKKLY
ncbi:helix-turn-helix transcriptional regulator [Ruminococcus sp.]|uniref:helix-turn-helix transcriptional regulator n=1 Tax=Ruminococcus sp. TaxID=41978 RepID=UPI002E7A5F41|nr:WYL domain-containing protein [Ruminococcus sp.]MEE1262842.1 WYL domain-containing protein [Ruminococcus sp.]